MRVYLIRHGQAEDAAMDHMRPLSRQGCEDITRVAGFLSLFEKPMPKRIVHSSKLRAAQTAGMVAEAWQVEDVCEASDLQPSADPEVWASRLSSYDADIALVGHLPHLGRLAGQLICGNSNCEAVRMQAGAVLCLERSEWGWCVLWHIHPALFYNSD